MKLFNHFTVCFIIFYRFPALFSYLFDTTIHTFMYIDTLTLSILADSHADTLTNKHTHTHTRTYARAHTHAHTHTHTHTHIYICTCIYIYIYILIHCLTDMLAPVCRFIIASKYLNTEYLIVSHVCSLWYMGF